MNTYRLLIITSFFFLTGCIGKQVNLGGAIKDSLPFTIQNLPNTESRCITLTRPVTVPSSLFSNCTLPAGRYIARKKNSTGYFYYAPYSIKTSNWLLSGKVKGIYLDKQMNDGNVIITTGIGVFESPMRGLVLPRTIFKYIKKSC